MSSIPSEKTTPLVFVTTIFGENYFGFLPPHLHSVFTVHPEAIELVLWQDMPGDEIERLSKAYPNCRFTKVEKMIEGNSDQKIARRIQNYVQACREYSDSPLCFIDSDILLVKPINEFLSSDFDVIFTWKDEPFPINGGMQIVKTGQIGEKFFQEWSARTEKIVSDPQLMAKALRVSGAADQQALRELIGFVNYAGTFQRKIAGGEMTFKGVECRYLNETACTPISEDTHAIHYKSGWHSILLENKGFNRRRPVERCLEQHKYWMDVNQSACRHLARHMVISACQPRAQAFRQAVDDYEERGILHSEMLAVCALCDELKVDVIIESGRCRGQSTLVLARYFNQKPVQIFSVEYIKDENAAFAERRLSEHKNVTLLYGDSFKLVPRLLAKHRNKRVALLVDGPKGSPAVSLIREAVRLYPNLKAAFLHDSRPETDARTGIEKNFARIFFTDSAEYQDNFSSIDEACLPKPGAPITIHTWRPFMKGENTMSSYGPTLGIILPVPGIKFQEMTNSPGINGPSVKDWVKLFLPQPLVQGYSRVKSKFYKLIKKL